VGVACISENEQVAAFPGFSTNEINVTEGTPQCASGVCLADHFQGRASCPYGQTQSDLDKPPSDPARCRTTTKDNVVGSTPVTEVVPPQIVDRRAEDVMICSCVCGGDDPNRPTHCSCPAGMECAPLVVGFDGGIHQAYCIKSGKAYVRGSTPTTCSRTDTTPSTDCGNDRQNP
jgi:hypothetical protein